MAFEPAVYEIKQTSHHCLPLSVGNVYITEIWQYITVELLQYTERNMFYTNIEYPKTFHVHWTKDILPSGYDSNPFPKIEPSFYNHKMECLLFEWGWSHRSMERYTRTVARQNSTFEVISILAATWRVMQYIGVPDGRYTEQKYLLCSEEFSNLPRKTRPHFYVKCGVPYFE